MNISPNNIERETDYFIQFYIQLKSQLTFRQIWGQENGD